MSLNIVILAAGQGKRMCSSLPKVLHLLAGKPLLGHVLSTARGLNPSRLVIVYGYGGEAVQDAFKEEKDLRWALQSPPLGTGDALTQALPHLDADVPTLVLYGDVPLICLHTLKTLIQQSVGGLGLLTAFLPDPQGYGRIVRDSQGFIRAIAEEKDASPKEREIHEINTGIMLLPTQSLTRWLPKLSRQNTQNEYYLTDVISLAVAENMPITSFSATHLWEVEGVNNPIQLAQLERGYQYRLAKALLSQGVRLLDPARLDIRGHLECGQDVLIDVGCVFEGDVRLGDGVSIAPYCVIRDSVIHSGARIAAFSHIDKAEVGKNAVVGPYARLRPGTCLDENAHVGNFVEIKNSRIGKGSKANHLSYIGDATVGARVNIGAGVITCNYDGQNKFETTIKDDAFIGSDTQLVAPVTVEQGATIGAGTTLTKTAPAHALTVSRARQTSFSDWRRPEKNKS